MDKIVSEIKEHIDWHFNNFNKWFLKHEKWEENILEEYSKTMKEHSETVEELWKTMILYKDENDIKHSKHNLHHAILYAILIIVIITWINIFITLVN